MNLETQTFLMAMTPIGELRASIPFGIAYGLNWLVVYVISILGNLIPPLFILLFLEPTSSCLSSRFKNCEKFFLWLFERTRKKTKDKVEKYGVIALILFVAIPLPFTGAYTGAIASYLFGIPFKKAFPLIGLGVIIAGTIVLSIIKTGLYFT